MPGTKDTMILKIEGREATDYTPARQVVAVLGEGAEDLTASFRGGDAEKFARLLVAGPGMVEALGEIKRLIANSDGWRGLESDPLIFAIMQTTCAAIAAAKGEN